MGHEMKDSMTYTSRSSTFVLYPEEFLQAGDFALYLEKWSHLFHVPVILSYILKCIWCINIILGL